MTSDEFFPFLTHLPPHQMICKCSYNCEIKTPTIWHDLWTSPYQIWDQYFYHRPNWLIWWENLYFSTFWVFKERCSKIKGIVEKMSSNIGSPRNLRIQSLSHLFSYLTYSRLELAIVHQYVLFQSVNLPRSWLSFFFQITCNYSSFCRISFELPLNLALVKLVTVWPGSTKIQKHSLLEWIKKISKFSTWDWVLGLIWVRNL